MSELIPYELSLGDEPLWVVDKPSTRLEYLKDHPEMEPRTLGLIAIGAFRENTYADYLAIARLDDKDETESWIRVHEQYEWLDWMAGTVYRDPTREKQLKDMERKLGRFIVQFGWAPDYILETRPSDQEMESFIAHVVAKDEIGGELTFREEEDGA